MLLADAVVAAGPGLDFGDWYKVGLLFLGLAVFAAIGALSHEHERAFSASLIYLGLGLVAAVAIELFGVAWLDPVDDAEVVERLTEVAVIVALFAAGLKLDRPLGWRRWASVARLLGLAMPLTIAAVAAYAAGVMGLSVAAAIVLGAALAPTDPVLAGDIGVGPPGEEEEREPNFAVTAEAGLNDGLALPFLILGLFAAAEGGTGWLGEWVLAELLYGTALGLVLGGASGWALAALILPLRERELLAPALDGWVAIAAVLLVYGLTETLSGYGFLAAFAAGLAFRRYERDHELNVTVHQGAEVVEKFGELAAILLLGSLVTVSGLENPGWSGLALAPLLILVVRPLSVLAAFAGSGLPLGQRAFLAWFGVRGIGSLYYAAVAAGAVSLAAESKVTIVWTVVFCVLVSIVVHGVTGAPLTRRFLEEEALTPGRGPAAPGRGSSGRSRAAGSRSSPRRSR
jgi:NhaP-type Na+/H+ or K+/H+ antiporter